MSTGHDKSEKNGRVLNIPDGQFSNYSEGRPMFGSALTRPASLVPVWSHMWSVGDPFFEKTSIFSQRRSHFDLEMTLTFDLHVDQKAMVVKLVHSSFVWYQIHAPPHSDS